MKTAANRALEWRKKYGRGGTAVGVARARDIKNGAELSESTVKRMHSFFSRHGNNKAKHYAKKKPDGGPTAWRVAWDLWGGNAGASWAKGIVNRLDERQEDIQMERHVINVEETEDSFIVELAKEERAEESAEEVSADYDDERDHKAMTEDMEAIEVIEADRDSEVKVEYRAMGMDKGPIDEEGRTAMIALSSEEPVERSFGNEVLEHSAEAIDLSFIASGRAPLLMDHDPKQQIGVVESVELDGESRRLRAKVRFGRNGLAAEAFSDVVDGIKANISVGYAINKMEKRDKDTYVAKSWRPVEASLVSLPADVTVGVGRSSEPSQPITVTENRSNPMTEQVIESVDVAAVQAEARKAEQR
ncbi:HK97 family phage prohead protease, partial [Planktomarina sp.]|uniref:HK97 family phage prohead protease n=1 Tax=Planktomarina sp. TaxID=2024851 RepID=UPI003260B678